jgi:ABC-type multidrug transport system fused ATPase/permease subunit
MKPLSSTLKLRLTGAEAPAEASPPEAEAPQAPAAPSSSLPRTMYGYVMRYSWRQQLAPLVLTAVSFPFLYYSYDLPKTIVNRAIGGKKFPQDFFGLDLDQIPYLMVLCALFLALVFINGGFKYYINVLKGRLGERMLRRLRYELYHRLLRFPLAHFKKVQPGEIIPMVTSEVEQLGGFIGDAIVLPIFQGGQLLTTIAFMFIQDPVLGAAAVALYPVQGYVIPKLQRKVNQLGKARVRTIRTVADRIGESAAGAAEIHANDSIRLQLAVFSHIMGRIYDIRFEIYQRKFFVKFLNNFLGQLTPFFFYAVGGYLVIRGNLSFGALVAVLAAYKDLASPWNELLTFYQLKETARITYEQVVEQFEPEGMIDARLQLEEPPEIPHLQGEISFANLSLNEDDRARILDAVTLSFPATEHVAVVGSGTSGKTELAMLLARLIRPSGGRILLGGTDLATLPNAVLGRRIGYAGATPHLFSGSLRDNLYFGLKCRPLRKPERKPAVERKVAAFLAESRRAGNIDLDLDADWIDYEIAGVADAAALERRAVEVLHTVDLAEDVYSFGLRGRLDGQNPAIAERLLAARAALADRLKEEGASHLVERFDPAVYNHNASVAENLLFGTPVGPVFDFDALAQNDYVLQVLDKVGLTADLVHVGEEVAHTMVELFADLAPDHEFFEQFSFINAADLPEFQALLGRLAKAGRQSLKPEDRTRLLSLPFKLIPARHRLDLLDAALQNRILEARKVFAEDLPEELRPQIEFFDPGRYNAAATLLDNVLFGKMVYGEAEAPTRVPRAIRAVLDSLELRDKVIAVGLDFGVGSGGSRLSVAQRQKGALARALLKRPDLLILNEATAALDGPTQAKIFDGVKGECAGRGVVWVLHRAAMARQFDRVIVLDHGRVAEQGRVADLDREGTAFGKLVAGE